MSESFTATLVQDQFYEIQIDWSDIINDASISLEWSYTSQPQVVIPSTNFWVPEYVDSSPYTVTVVCPTGYEGDYVSTPNVCVEKCGDGLEVGTEACDDGNTNSADGCAADCSTVEAGWVCSGGSSTSADTCTQCTSGWYQDNPTNPENCVSQCGDGFEVGTEK